jgi:Amt family ammonium transporter
MPKVNAGDTAWLLASAALVMFMTPGLALFYGGLVRAKNVVGIVMQSFVALAVVGIVWALIGYTLAFGPDKGLVIGGLKFFGLKGVGATPNAYAPTVPSSAYMVFQMMFAIITPALITGAFAERMKFSGYLLFLVLWSIFVYAPVAHWVWGGGFLGSGGVKILDFAGGTVVHANAGAAALAAAIYLGRRRGLGTDAFKPHNVPMVVLGAGILWFGWFGFNAGSALSAGSLASSAFVATQLGAAAGVIGWLVPEGLRHGRFSSIGAATGAVAGLATITPAAGYVPPWAAILIGLAAGVICFYAVDLKSRFRYDDSLDVVGVHMVGGMLGTILTGIFARLAINAAGAAGGLEQFGRQLVGAFTVPAFSFVATMILLWVCDRTVGLRVTEDEEMSGLDLSMHGEAGYTWTESMAAAVTSPAALAADSAPASGPPDAGTEGSDAGSADAFPRSDGG